MNIPEGILKKEVKTKEQKTKDIEEVRLQMFRDFVWPLGFISTRFNFLWALDSTFSLSNFLLFFKFIFYALHSS